MCVMGGPDPAQLRTAAVCVTQPTCQESVLWRASRPIEQSRGSREGFKKDRNARKIAKVKFEMAQDRDLYLPYMGVKEKPGQCS